MSQYSTHETFSREEDVAPSSERSFGLVIAGALAIVGAVNWWHSGRVWPWCFGAAAVFAFLGYFNSAVLKPLNRLWFRLGMLLHAVVNPIIIGVVFYCAVLPTGLVMRALGKDLLRLKTEPDSDSYWIKREPPGPAPQSMKDQF